MKEYTCIICPRGCRIFVDGDEIRGAHCERGIAYVKEEGKEPMRMVTSTVKIKNAVLPRLPVKTSAPIPKRMVMRAVKLLNDVQITAPIMCGGVVLQNILGTGVDFVASKTALPLEEDK